METRVGFTPIDTYYEFQGFRLAEGFYEKFFNFFFVFIIGCSLVYLLAKKDRSMGELLRYLGYIVVVVFLVSPSRTKINVPEYVLDDQALKESMASWGKSEPTMKAPRVMVLLHYLADSITTSALEISKSQWTGVGTRLTPLLRNSRIYDDDLAERYRVWLSSCYLLSYQSPKVPNAQLLNPFLESYSAYESEPAADSRGEPLFDAGGRAVSCAQELQSLRNAIFEHARTHRTHRETDAELKSVQEYASLRGRQPPFSGTDRTQYLFNTIVQNETRAYFVLTEGRGEVAAVQEAIGEYHALSGDHAGISIYGDGSFGNKLKRAVSWIVMAKQSFDSWFQQNAEVPAMYYKVTTYAPFIYGFAMMTLLAFFPLAAIASLLPWGWTALVKWAKSVLWIKFWLIGWAIIQDYNFARMDWSGELAQTYAGKDYDQIWAGIVAMYVATPALAWTAIQLLDKSARAAGGMIGSLVPGGAGAGGNQYSDRVLGAVANVGEAVLTGGASEGASAAQAASASSGSSPDSGDGPVWVRGRGNSWVDAGSGFPANFPATPPGPPEAA